MILKDNNKYKKESLEKAKKGLGVFINEFRKEGSRGLKLLILIFISYGTFTSFNFLMGKILDAALTNNTITFFGISFSELFFLFFILFLVFTIEVLVNSYESYYYRQKIAMSVYKRYIKNSFAKVINFPTSFFKTQSLGKITYSFQNSGEIIFGLINNASELFGVILLILFNLFFLLLVNIKVAILAIIGFLLYILIF